MTNSDPPSNLLDPRFLPFFEWLAQFIGIWQFGNGQHQVRRRPEGWIQANTIAGPSATLEDILTLGTMTEAPVGPLGPRPVILSFALMQRWLDAEQFKRLQHAVHTTAGRREILYSVEAAMIAAGPTAVRIFLYKEWTNAIMAGSKIPEADDYLVRRLWIEFQRTMPQ